MPTANSDPFGITAGPDGNLWFTEYGGNKIGMINPTTHAISEFPVPTAGCRPRGITAGPDGNLWFTEYHGNKIGMINPTTHAITEFPIPTAASGPVRDHGGARRQPLVHRARRQQDRDDQPDDPRHHRVPHPDRRRPSPSGITAGPDGNLWFTEVSGNKIGSINPTTHAIAEFPVPTAGPRPSGSRRARTATSGSPRSTATRSGRSTRSPDGITETAVPTADLRAPRDHGGSRRQPLVRRGDVARRSASSRRRSASSPRPSPRPSSRRRPLRPDRHRRLPVGPARHRLQRQRHPRAGLQPRRRHPRRHAHRRRQGRRRHLLRADPQPARHRLPDHGLHRPADHDAHHPGDRRRPRRPSRRDRRRPPTIVAEKVIFAGKGRRKHVVGYELDFSTAMDPTRAASLANYTLTQFQRHGRKLVSSPVAFRAAYDATAAQRDADAGRQGRSSPRGASWWSSPGRRAGSPTRRARRWTGATRASSATTGPSSSARRATPSRDERPQAARKSKATEEFTAGMRNQAGTGRWRAGRPLSSQAREDERCIRRRGSSGSRSSGHGAAGGSRRRRRGDTGGPSSSRWSRGNCSRPSPSSPRRAPARSAWSRAPTATSGSPRPPPTRSASINPIDPRRHRLRRAHRQCRTGGHHGRARRQPLVHRAPRQQDRDDQPDDPRHHRVRHPDRL